MSQYPGGQPPQDPYYGRPPSDPYFGQPPADPYASPPPPPSPNEPWYGQPPADPYAQQAQCQYWYGQPQGPWQPAPQAPPAAVSTRAGGGAGAAIAGIFLVLLGVWFLFRDEISIDIGRVWPVAAVALGVLMVIAAFIPRRGG